MPRAPLHQISRPAGQRSSIVPAAALLMMVLAAGCSTPRPMAPEEREELSRLFEPSPPEPTPIAAPTPTPEVPVAPEPSVPESTVQQSLPSEPVAATPTPARSTSVKPTLDEPIPQHWFAPEAAPEVRDVAQNVGQNIAPSAAPPRVDEPTSRIPSPQPVVNSPMPAVAKAPHEQPMPVLAGQHPATLAAVPQQAQIVATPPPHSQPTPAQQPTEANPPEPTPVAVPVAIPLAEMMPLIPTKVPRVPAAPGELLRELKQAAADLAYVPPQPQQAPQVAQQPRFLAEAPHPISLAERANDDQAPKPLREIEADVMQTPATKSVVVQAPALLDLRSEPSRPEVKAPPLLSPWHSPGNVSTVPSLTNPPRLAASELKFVQPPPPEVIPPQAIPPQVSAPQAIASQVSPPQAIPREAVPTPSSRRDPLNSPGELLPPGYVPQTPTNSLAQDIRPIGQLSINIAPPAALDAQGTPLEIPDNYAREALAGAQPYTRGMHMDLAYPPMSPAAPGLEFCYQPLYFEEVNVERYGRTAGRFQPVLSAAQFYSRIPALPYLVFAQPARQCTCHAHWDLPGYAAPLELNPPPASVLGAVSETFFVYGMILLIP